MRKPLVRLLTVDEFAEATGWKPSTVRQKVWQRQLPYIKLGRSLRISEDTLHELITNSMVPALPAPGKKRKPAPRKQGE